MIGIGLRVPRKIVVLDRPARRQPRPGQHDTFDGPALKCNRREKCIHMAGTMARLAPPLPFGVPKVLLAIHTALVLQEGRNDVRGARAAARFRHASWRGGSLVAAGNTGTAASDAGPTRPGAYH
jgi:hypothetical protein